MTANRAAIRAIRQGKRIGLRKLERQTGISRGFLSQIELGRRGASARTLARIAKGLDVPIDAITMKTPEADA